MSADLKAIIAPSLLSGDFAQLAYEVKRITTECGADWVHMDVMDGHFVPNLTIGAPVIKSLRPHTKSFIDCHLMVSNPECWVDDFAKAGADSFTFHIEATDKPKELINNIKSKGMKAAIAVKPKTDINTILDIVPLLDMVLIMSVEPGFGGQAFMEEVCPKISLLRKQFPLLNIQVDGGIKEDNIHIAAEAGANVIVSGSGIFKAPNHKLVIENLRNAVNKAIVNNNKKN